MVEGPERSVGGGGGGVGLRNKKRCRRCGDEVQKESVGVWGCRGEGQKEGLYVNTRINIFLSPLLYLRCDKGLCLGLS